jgi:hypothetical protein
MATLARLRREWTRRPQLVVAVAGLSASVVAVGAIFVFDLVWEPPGPRYQQVAFDLCERIDLAPLDDLSLTLWQARDPFPDFPFGGRCEFGMRTADGHRATLTAAVDLSGGRSGYPDDQYQDRFDRVLENRNREGILMPELGAINGVGDRANAFVATVEPEPGLRVLEYLMIARHENLLAEVSLRVGGDDYPSKDALADAVRAIVTGTMASVPPAPAPSPPPDRVEMGYDTTNIDMCRDIDLTPLEALPVPVTEMEDTSERDSYGAYSAACHARLGDLNDRIAVVADAYEDFGSAEVAYTASREGTMENADDEISFYSVADLGERATVRTELAEFWVSADVIVLSGNLKVFVYLTIRPEHATHQELASIARDIAADVLEQVPIVSKP